MNGNHIESSDLYQRGFGEPGVDFLDTERRASNIVTNPPYNSAEGCGQPISSSSNMFDKALANDISWRATSCGKPTGFRNGSPRRGFAMSRVW
jgi:hypothetical protein